MMTASLLVALCSSGAVPDVPHFDSEIIPIFTKAGCNAGSCHGAAAGRGGFHLSLLGSDPAADYDTVVHALEGRRINPTHPEKSLLLRKPAGQIEHGGDIVLPEGSAGETRLRAWIAAGAPRGKPRKLTHFHVRAAKEVIEHGDTGVTLHAIARFDDGPEMDVTAWTVFTSSDSAAIRIEDTDSPKAQILRPGQHVIIARFLDRVEPIRVLRPLGNRPIDFRQELRANFIDEEIYRTLAMLRIPVSPQSDDATFHRRVRIDLTGTLPTPEEVETFLGDHRHDKRERLVDQLLASDAFADYWTLRFSRMLRIHSLPGDKQGILSYTSWLRKALKEDRPLDHVARELLTATGDSHEHGPANFPRMVNDARGQAELVSRVFLGVRMQCANCHNHPLDRWTQDDYHGLAANFSRVERGRYVKLAARGAVTNLRTGEPAIPRIPGDRYLAASDDTLTAFADWVTAKNNPYFAKAMVNRAWRAMLGRGLVEPVDDMRVTNPATHPRLLEALAEDFIRNGFHLKRTLRLIALSQAYGRSTQAVPGNETDDRYYARGYHRALEPEVLADAISSVTGITQSFDGFPRGTRAITLYDPLTPAPVLDLLGRCNRVASCEENNVGGGLAAKLHLLNGTLLNEKLAAPEGRLAGFIAAGKTDTEIIRAFYLHALARQPSSEERTRWLKLLEAAGPAQRRAALEDFVWAMLNSREFIHNH